MRRSSAACRGRGDPGRRPQHGRIRLRLHRPRTPITATAQSARPGAHRRRLVGRFGRRGRRRPRAAGARLRHQRLDPGAGLAVRHLRVEADLRPAEPSRQRCLFAASLDHVGPLARSVATSPPPTTRCRADSASTRSAPIAIEPASPEIERGAAGLRIAVAGGYFAGTVPRRRGGGKRRAGARRQRHRSRYPRRPAPAPPPSSSPRAKAPTCISPT